jgi:hypothetical protein
MKDSCLFHAVSLQTPDRVLLQFIAKGGACMSVSIAVGRLLEWGNAESSCKLLYSELKLHLIVDLQVLWFCIH